MFLIFLFLNVVEAGIPQTEKNGLRLSRSGKSVDMFRMKEKKKVLETPQNWTNIDVENGIEQVKEHHVAVSLSRPCF